MKREDAIRALLNDTRTQKIWDDERIAPFIEQADVMANVYAAYLLAISVGAYRAADRLARLLPLRNESQDMTKKDAADGPS